MKLLAIALGFAAVLLVAVAAGLAPALAQSVPGNVRAVDGANSGEATVSWQAVAVEDAAYYRIGWVSMDRFEAVRASRQNWLNAFAFTDVDNSGQAAHTLTDLAPGDRYAFIIGITGNRFGVASWSEWAYLTLADAPTSCPTDAGEPTPPQSATPTPAATPAPSATPAPTQTPTPTPSPTPASTHTRAGRGDYDADNDGLIEISSLAQLNAIRYDLGGNGATPTPGYAVAFPDAIAGMGCPERCAGYELVANLDFDTNGNGAADAGDEFWNDGAGWDPIGDERHRFVAAFDGNSHTIANLFINRSGSDENDYGIGLFGYAGSGSIFEQVGLLSVAVSGAGNVGSLVGYINEGTISDSYAAGIVFGRYDYVGGLIGVGLLTTISDSYATVNVTGERRVGGLVGSAFDGGITNSYATGNVSGSDGTIHYVGGLVGEISRGTISDSYATGNVTGDNGHAGITQGHRYYVGGLVGAAGITTVSGSYATGNVTGSIAGGYSRDVGGLIGEGHKSTIRDSYATGDVSGHDNIGGLVGGGRFQAIGGSYATGNVSGGEKIGGLVGHGRGDISGSHATGSVNGGGNVGGLVGHSENGAISSSYATGSVSGGGHGYHVGGLVGRNQIAISASYATGNVSSNGAGNTSYVGGLVGINDGGAISNSYAKGSVSGSGDDIGGLVGRNSRGSIAASYAIGSVSTLGDTAYIGGLVGYDEGGEISASYWDTQTTGQASPGYGGVGKTTSELQSPTGATGIYADWDASAWDFGNSREYPVLKYDGMDVTGQQQ